MDYKRVLIFFSLLIIGVTCFSTEAQNEEIIFRWAFLHKTSDGIIKEIDLTSQFTPMVEGDQFKIYLQSVKNAYIYLFLYDMEENLYLLYPSESDYYTTNELVVEEFGYIPGETRWFGVDDTTGIEKFYLLVSSDRLTSLEKLTADYTESKNDKVNAKQKVIERIELLIKEKSMFLGEDEVPFAVAGEWRAIDTEILFNATEVKTEYFYAKKIRIKH